MNASMQGFPLPDDPTDEELARDWNLSEADKAEVLECRGADNRLRFALQLCSLRLHGRFLDGYASCQVSVLNHLNRQLDLQPVLCLGSAQCLDTEYRHLHRIREYLGFGTFDDAMQERMERELHSKVTEEFAVEDLLRQAHELLRSWRVVLPSGPSTLERIVASVAFRGQTEVLEIISQQLPPGLCQSIDELLEVPEGKRLSSLSWLKEYPSKVNAATIREQLRRYDAIRSTGVGALELQGVSLKVVKKFAELASCHKVTKLRCFAPPKRYALMACFLIEASKTCLDHVVDMYDQFMTNVVRNARNAYERLYRQTRRGFWKQFDKLACAFKLLLKLKRGAPEMSVANADLGADDDALEEALKTCFQVREMERRGHVDQLRGRYSDIRKFLPYFLELPFKSETGSQILLEAIEISKQLTDGELRQMPAEVPLKVIPAKYRKSLFKEDGTIDRRVWEIGLALAIRDALRSGDLYLPESRHHVSFWNLIYAPESWEEERAKAYDVLSLPNEADEVVEGLIKEFNEVADAANRSLNKNPFVTIENGRLHVKRADAIPTPRKIVELRQAIHSNFPRIRIEDLLVAVDSCCGFTRKFQPLEGHNVRGGGNDEALLAVILAHGTNLGLAAMSQSTDGLSVEKLQNVAKWFVREQTINEANAAMVNYHHRLALSFIWGDGEASSSDGQRFAIEGNPLVGSYYPRYFGYYDRAFSVLAHISNQYSVFSTKVISCSKREALYVLDGLLENETILDPKEHYTDTHGFTEHIFGLCYLLHVSFMPRIKNLKKQRLYKPYREKVHHDLEPLFHETVDVNLIREQWDQLVRVAASLRDKENKTPAHVIVERLSRTTRSDRLAKALTALGRIVKTVFVLRWVQDPALRRKVTLQLNRGEERQGLSRWLCFSNQGIFRHVRDVKGLMNKASCLSLLSNAVLVWNTVKMADTVAQLRANGAQILDEHLARVSPLAFRHVIPNGKYHFRLLDELERRS